MTAKLTVILLCAAAVPLTADMGTLTTLPPEAATHTFGFDCITDNSDEGDCNVGATQLSVMLSEEAPQHVAFTFKNVGGQPLPSRAFISKTAPCSSRFQVYHGRFHI